MPYSILRSLNKVKKITAFIFLLLFGNAAFGSGADMFRQFVWNPDFQFFKSHYFSGDMNLKGGYHPGVEAYDHEGI